MTAANRLLVTIVLTLTGCAGDYIDFQLGSASNCRVIVFGDWTEYGYRIRHTWSALCPLHVIRRGPWMGASANFQATLSGPLDAPSQVMQTEMFNYNGAPVGDAQTVLQEFGDRLVGFANVYYTAATVEVQIGQEAKDYAWNTPNNVPGAAAEVQLNYTGTQVLASGPSTALENEPFQLTVFPEGVPLTPPITYQWFRGGDYYGTPTTSNYLSATVSGSGFTMPFRVEATDATGLVVKSMTWVTVPANCPNPPCAGQ